MLSQEAIEHLAAEGGHGRLQRTHSYRPVAQLISAPIIGLTTLVLGFGGDILAYQIVGSLLTVGLLVQAFLISRFRKVYVFAGCAVFTSTFGLLKDVVTWSQVSYVEGVAVDISNGGFTATRNDFTVNRWAGKPIKFNDVLVTDGAQLAATIALRTQPRHVL